MDSCSVPQCGRRVYRRHLCSTHYRRDLAGEDLNAPIRLRPEPISRRGMTCAVDGCDRPVHARGICWMHYRRTLRAKKRAATATSCLDAPTSTN